MKKNTILIISSLLIAALLTLSCPLACAARRTPRKYTAARLTQSPEIDGLIEDDDG